MVKNLPVTAGDIRDIRSLGWEDALEEGMTTTPIFFPAASHGQRSLVGYTVHGVAQSQTWLKHLICTRIK